MNHESPPPLLSFYLLLLQLRFTSFRERSDLLSTVNMLRSTVSNLQQREADALRQIQQSVEVAEQAQLERVQVFFDRYM